MKAVQSPEFSVIIPTYNRPGPLNACLKALATQDVELEFEVIVVDDGGSCDAGLVVEAWRESLDVRLRRRSNGGPAAARNAGAETARGRWLAFTDDDCEASPGWLAAMKRATQENPEALLGGRTLNALTNNPCASASQLIQDSAYMYYNQQAAGASFFAANNMVLPAAGFRELGGFDPSFRTAEDRDLCDRWRASGRILMYVPEAVIRHSREMGLREFWRQHVGYGRGARRFQVAHRKRDATTSTIQPGFYCWLLRAAPRLLRDQPSPLAQAALLGIWQLANTTGFFLEWLKSENRHHEAR